MSQEHHKFDKGKIIDQLTVEGNVDCKQVSIEVLDGGLPDGTYRVTVGKHSMRNGNVVIGAFVHGKSTPITVRGKLRNSVIEL